jgi:large subunit ribosomal protein L10
MPSFINELMLNEVKSLVSGSTSLIVLDSSKLNSSDSLKLRKELRGVGAKLKVAKVAIIKRSVPPAVAKLCDGKCSIGVVLATDMVAAAKVLAVLSKEDKISVKGGLMDGLSLDPAGVTRLASLPGKDTLRGMLVNLLAAPLVGFVRVIAEIEKKKNPAAAAASAPEAAAAP